MKKFFTYFTLFEWLLWSLSCTAMITLFFIFDRTNYLSLICSLLGSTSLIFVAKGNPVGQVLVILFGALYGYVSFTFAYYGEMVTMFAMNVPLAVFSLIMWLKHPYNGNRAEVKVNSVSKKTVLIMLLCAAAVTTAFYFILSAFHTANIIPSTISIATSFIAVFLMAMRSPYYALAFCANDAVLIVLWSMATAQNISYISTLVCFVAFLANDTYSFINWRRMQKRQNAAGQKEE